MPKFVNLMELFFKQVRHIVVTIAEHASDVAPKRIIRLLIHRLQKFFVKYEYL